MIKSIKRLRKVCKHNIGLCSLVNVFSNVLGNVEKIGYCRKTYHKAMLWEQKLAIHMQV